MPQQRLRHVAAGRRHQLDSGELDRLIVVHPPCQAITDSDLNRCCHRPNRERDHKTEIVVTVPPAAQHPRGINRRDQKPAHQIGRNHHVGRLPGHGVVEDHPGPDPPRSHFRSSPVSRSGTESGRPSAPLGPTLPPLAEKSYP
jgi:hypothetical protein